MVTIYTRIERRNLIKFNAVSKSYDHGQTQVVKNLTWDIAEGELFVIMGSSGSGKSTALKMINRLIRHSYGTIEINGTDINTLPINELRQSMGYVFQKIGLFPHMTVAENIHIVLRVQNKLNSYSKKHIAELLDLVNLDPAIYSNRYPKQLSGGQQQRVGIARALATNPSLILMDEPFSALDAITREVMQQEIKSLQKKLGKTIVFVTHDMFEAFEMGDRIALLDRGVLQQIGKPSDILNTPETNFVSQMIQTFKNQILTYYDQIKHDDIHTASH